MMSEMYIQNYRLDISTEISSLITFELDNIKNFAARSTTWSKTIVLPGTANNNKLFGHIFQMGQSNTYDDTIPNVNYNFNASKSADCIIFQNQIQTFSGILRLLQINIIKGRIEYEVAVFGKLAQLNVALNGSFLTDLDFSAYDHTYNAANIIASWDNAPGSGYYYPHIDYGLYSSGKHDWDIRTFRPALYVKEIIDKMFEAASFRYSSAIIDTDRFKRLIVPNGQKQLTSLTYPNLLDTSLTGAQSGPATVAFDTITSSHFNLAAGNTQVTYINATSVTGILTIAMTGQFTNCDLTVTFRKNGVPFLIKNFTYSGSGSSPSFFSINESVSPSMLFATSDYLTVTLVKFNDLGGSSYVVNQCQLGVVGDTPTDNPITVGSTVDINATLPKNVRQIDFLASVIKLFNLYVYEDRFDNSLIYITPYINFYNTSISESIDWTYKLNRDKPLKIRPMSELTARKYDFRYKPDSDYFNELYRKRYGQGYGDYTFDSLYEFSQENQSTEIIFSATPLVGYAGEDKVYSTIFKKTNELEENIDSNIRILQSKKIVGVSSWDIKDGVSVLSSVTDYGYAGHLDDPDAPSNDLNFGNVLELFFVLATGDLTQTQFNVYWSTYMAEITDKDSKLLSAWFYLNTADILALDFSKKIMIDGILFRLNSVSDYNATRPTDTLVELFKVATTNYTEVPVPPDLLLWDDGQRMLWDDSQRIKYA